MGQVKTKTNIEATNSKMAVCQNPRYPCSSHQNSWDLWMFIPLKMVLIGIDPYQYERRKQSFASSVPKKIDPPKTYVFPSKTCDRRSYDKQLQKKTHKLCIAQEIAMFIGKIWWWILVIHQWMRWMQRMPYGIHYLFSIMVGWPFLQCEAPVMFVGWDSPQ